MYLTILRICVCVNLSFETVHRTSTYVNGHFFCLRTVLKLGEHMPWFWYPLSLKQSLTGAVCVWTIDVLWIWDTPRQRAADGNDQNHGVMKGSSALLLELWLFSLAGFMRKVDVLAMVEPGSLQVASAESSTASVALSALHWTSSWIPTQTGKAKMFQETEWSAWCSEKGSEQPVRRQTF